MILNRSAIVAACAAVTAFVTGLGTSDALGAIPIATVNIGNAGNGTDPVTGNLYGAVANAYSLGTYEVSNTQYAAFLNAVAATDTNNLYSVRMPGITRAGAAGSYTYATVDGKANMPVVYVSFWDSARFANWLQNGQPNGAQDNTTTERGAYTLTAAAIANNTVTRNANWQWAIPTENEWYKAAYYQPRAQGGDTDNYWLYPISDNFIAAEDANYRAGVVVGSTVNVGSYDANFYGTYDMGGNVFEWNEAILDVAFRGIRGGSFVFSELFLQSNRWESAAAANESDDIGFRVVAVPAPGSAVLLGLGGLFAAGARSRRQR